MSNYVGKYPRVRETTHVYGGGLPPFFRRFSTILTLFPLGCLLLRYQKRKAIDLQLSTVCYDTQAFPSMLSIEEGLAKARGNKVNPNNILAVWIGRDE